jgi:hypothetical protein
VFGSGRSCVVSENLVAIFCRRVAGEALCVQRLVARLAVREVGKSPAPGYGVLFESLTMNLNVHGGPGKGGVETGIRKTGSQGFVVCV